MTMHKFTLANANGWIQEFNIEAVDRGEALLRVKSALPDYPTAHLVDFSDEERRLFQEMTDIIVRLEKTLEGTQGHYRTLLNASRPFSP